MEGHHDTNNPFRYANGDPPYHLAPGPAPPTMYLPNHPEQRHVQNMMYYSRGTASESAPRPAMEPGEYPYPSQPPQVRAGPGPSTQEAYRSTYPAHHQGYQGDPVYKLSEPVGWSQPSPVQAGNPNDPQNDAASSLNPITSTTTGPGQAKKVRTQFSACQACRNRRVKCDLKDVQEEWESLEIPSDTPAKHGAGAPPYPPGSDHKFGPSLPPNLVPGQNGNPLLDPVTGEMYRARGVLPTGKSRPGRAGRKTRDIRALGRDQLSCTNCFNRGTGCVDEYGDRRERRKGGVGDSGREVSATGLAEGGTGVDRRRGEVNAGNRFNPMGSDARNLGPSATAFRQNQGHLVDRGQRPALVSHHSASGYPRDSEGHLAGFAGEQSLPPAMPTVALPQQTAAAFERPLGLFDPNPRQYPTGSASSAQVLSGQNMDQPESLAVDTREIGLTDPRCVPVHTTLESGVSMGMTTTYSDSAPFRERYVGPPASGPIALAPESQTGPVQSSMVPPVEPSRTLNMMIHTRPVMPKRQSVSTPTTTQPSIPDPIEDQGEGEIPDLSRDFLTSAFYRRFHVQRPICDPMDFSRRYLAQDPPRASHMGKDGAILVHIMYAWACSYGVDETGCLDVPERNWPGGIMPPETGYVWSHDQVRDRDRLKRRAKTDGVVAKILKEIDDAGLMRRHSWDGVRCLLLILPLTEYVSTPMERLAMYECAVAQVFALCSLSSIGYDGLQHYLGPEGDIIRVRLYWYTFVHEGITSGLKGGRLVLDEDDLENFQASLPQGWALVTRSSAIKSVAKLATAPIRLAVACRLIHKALTGPKARKRERVDKRLMNDAWEALESCWEEFEAIRSESPGNFLQKDDIIRFADGWRIFMFEAHNVIRESLEHRCAHLVPRPEGAFLTELSLSAEETDPRIQIHREIQHLHDIARSKCEQLTRLIVDIVKMHINTSFFEWDASLVRDGTFYAAMLLAKDHGTEEDVAACLQALNEMRWAYAKTGERSNKLRDLWAERQAKLAFPAYSTPFGSSNASSVTPPSSGMLPPAHSLMTAISSLGANVSGWMPEGMLADTSSISQAVGTDFVGDIADSAGAGALPSTAAVPPSLEHSPTSLAGSSPPVPRADVGLPGSSWQTTQMAPGPAKGLFDAYTPPEDTRPVLPQLYHSGGLPYIQPSAGIHLSGQMGGQPQVGVRDPAGEGLVYPKTANHRGYAGWR